MDLNGYVVEALVRQRLDELRADADAHRLRSALARPRRPLRVRLGRALIRLGTWTRGPAGGAPLPRAS